jgi:acid phosphatase (class A)
MAKISTARRRRTLAGLALAAALAATGLTAAAQMVGAPPPARPVGYLSPAQLPDSLTVIGPPPAAGSLQDQADHEAYDRTRALEGTPRWRQARADVELFGPVAHRSFACALGKTITPAATPTLSRLLDRVVIDAGTSTAAAKDHYSRVRPAIGNAKPICVTREGWLKSNGSYPSGHAAAGWAWGLILAELAPDRASAVTVRAREFGDSRFICGVHFPTDVEAGRIMGAATVARLHADPVFAADMAAARAELERAPAPTDCAAP